MCVRVSCRVARRVRFPPCVSDTQGLAVRIWTRVAQEPDHDGPIRFCPKTINRISTFRLETSQLNAITANAPIFAATVRREYPLAFRLGAVCCNETLIVFTAASQLQERRRDAREDRRDDVIARNATELSIPPKYCTALFCAVDSSM